MEASIIDGNNLLHVDKEDVEQAFWCKPVSLLLKEGPPPSNDSPCNADPGDCSACNGNPNCSHGCA